MVAILVQAYYHVLCVPTPCLLQFVIWMKWHVVMILIVCDLGDGSCFLVIVLVILTQLYSDGYDLSKSSGIIASKSSGILKPSGSL